jgi:hypothetical protein
VILDGPDPKAANNTILVLPNGRLMMSVSATCDHCRQTSRYSATVFLTGLENPLAATATSTRLLIGDWTTGRIYSIAHR